MIGRTVLLRRGNRSEAEKPFWISYADLMTALMVLFLVAMTVAMMTVTYNARDVERQKKELEQRNAELSQERQRLLEEQARSKNYEEQLRTANEQLEKLRKTQAELDAEAARPAARTGDQAPARNGVGGGGAPSRS